jgi:molybdopterin/thiamine biosynthesis adenylyltransferase
MLHVKRSDGVVLRIRNLEDQVYSMQDDVGAQYHWSVSEALELAQKRGELVTISLSEMGVTPERVLHHYDGLNIAYAMTTDLSKPLLFIPFDGQHRLIDGHHRLFRAAVEGVNVLTAYVLTEEEKAQCLVCYLPPGKGIDWGQSPRKEPKT